MVDSDELFEIRDQLRKYIDDCFKNNCDSVIDLIQGMRLLTAGLEENELRVRIRKGTYCEYANYENGQASSCGVYNQVWGNEIGVYSDYVGIEMHLKKQGVHLDSEEKKKALEAEFASFYEMIITLNCMNQEKREDQNKVYQIN